MRKSRKLALLMLPILAAYVFQATQYARAPVKYGYYVVYAENADIALRPYNDISPNGQPLLQNHTEGASQMWGYYNLTLGKWGPGYQVNYTEAFRVFNRELFNVTMVGFNFSATSAGGDYLKMYVYNDTNCNGDPTDDNDEITAWDGTETKLNATYYIFLANATDYGSDGGWTWVKICIDVETDVPELTSGVGSYEYTGDLYLWFTNA